MIGQRSRPIRLQRPRAEYAVAGLAAETGVVMQVYVDGAVGRYRLEKRLVSRAKLNDALEEGAVKRVRPKLMTVTTTILGLVPVMIGTGTELR